jgi:hypothetical protein
MEAYQYVTPTAKPRAGSTQMVGKSIKAPETGRTDTISAKHRITAITMIPAQAKAMTQPAEPDIAIISPELTKRPMPIVPENEMATRCHVRICIENHGHR